MINREIKKYIEDRINFIKNQIDIKEYFDINYDQNQRNAFFMVNELKNVLNKIEDLEEKDDRSISSNNNSNNIFI